MADFYCDISAIGAEYEAYADTPTTWAKPQDGNGRAGPGHAAAVAIGTINCASASASGAGILAVLGVTVSSTLTGTGAALAANIVAAINSAAGAAASIYSALLLPLNRLVYARQQPGTATTVQIMLRIAGSDWNGFTHTTAGTWATTPAMGAFSGGADGPFAYLFNTTSVFGKTAGNTGTAGPNYGLFFAPVGSVAEPGLNDVVHVRTRRSGANLVAPTWSTSGAASATWRARNYLFDNGTVWSGDNGRLTAAFKNTNGSTVNSAFAVPPASGVTFCSREKYNFEMQLAVTASSNGTFQVATFAAATGSFFAVNSCRLVEATDNLRNIVVGSESSSSTNALLDLSNSLVQWRGQMRSLFSSALSSTGLRLVNNGLEIEVVSASSALGPTITISGGGVVSPSIEWVGGEIRDSLGVYRCANPISANAAIDLDANLDSVVGVTDPSIGFTASTVRRGRLRWNQPEGPNKGFRYETPQFVIDWKGDGTFPFEGVAADLRGVNWSHRITWNSVPSAQLGVTPVRLSRFNRAAAAMKTITAQLYVPDATAFYLDELEFVVSYMDASDVWRTEMVGGARSQQFSTARTLISASAATWTANGVASYSAAKLELSTAYQVKQGSEIVARLTLCRSRATPLTFFMSPELGVA